MDARAAELPMNRGFTLVEVLVATLIFSVVLAAAYALFDSARTLSDRAEARAAVQQEARAALDALRSDLQGACKTDFLGTFSGSDDRPDSRLDLFSINHATFRATGPEADVTKTSYYVYEKKLVRRKQKQTTSTNAQLREDEGLEEMGPGVLYVKFRYYDGSSWSESWDSAQAKKLPRAVEATIHLASGEKFAEKIYLPIAAETPVQE